MADRLAIVGSRILTRSEVESHIREHIDKCAPKTVISGGADGVDLIAAEIARELGLEVVELLPGSKSWSSYKVRNMMIAEHCDALLAIVTLRSRTYGAGWTRDYAEKIGKPTITVLLP